MTPQKKHCYVCKKPESKKTILMIHGTHHKKTRYICRTCNTARQKKYRDKGHYTPTEW